ncbi:MAG: alpha/beta fold family hydrolase [Pseudomonadota bacterium]
MSRTLRFTRWLGCFGLAALCFVACRPAPSVSADPWARCWLPGLDEPARCRTVRVPAGPAAPDREVELFVAMLDAGSPDPQRAPLFFLAGGPGQAASRVAAAVLPSLRKVRRQRALVFVDQRGTGHSAPLDCRLTEPGRDALLDVFADTLAPDAVRRCRSGVTWPLSAYGTAQASDDLDAVRRALGLSRVALYGISYGTRLGLVHLARHGGTVEAAIFDGVLPAEVPLFDSFDVDGQAALQTLARDCLAEAPCARAYGDVSVAVGRLLDGLSEPRTVVARHPRTGQRVSLRVTRAGVALALRALLYDADVAATLPMAVSRAVADDFGPLWTATALLVDGADRTTDAGLMLAVTCAEDVPRLSNGLRVGFVGDAMVAQIRAACAVFEAPAAAPLPAAASLADAPPVLLLSGALDPVTPPRHAERLAQRHGWLHRVLPGVGHGAGRHGCGPSVMAEFLAEPRSARPDLDCGRPTRRPPFVLPDAGGTP